MEIPNQISKTFHVQSPY